MILLLLKNYWKYIVAGVAIIIACGLITHSIYSWGFDSSNKEWVARIEERDKLQKKQTDEIVKLSATLVEYQATQTKQSKENLDIILGSIKNKPLYKIVDGKCVFTQDFENTYINIIKEGSK